MTHVLALLRGLRKTPGFAAAAIATIAIGIAVTTALFTVVHVVVLKPLPFPEQTRLVRIWSSLPERNLSAFSISFPDFEDWRAQARTFELLAAYGRERDVTLTPTTAGGDPIRVSVARVDPHLFPLLGVGPVHGRSITAEDVAAARPVILLSHGFWLRHFGADETALGRQIVLNGDAYTIAGVMPAGFGIPNNASELWTPLSVQPNERDRSNRWLRVLGRLRPGQPVDAARSELVTIASRIAAADSRNTGWTVTVSPLFDTVVGTSFRQALQVLLAVVACVLAIGCANVAGLLFARGTGRRRELALRSALGAGRVRLIAEGITEGLLLAAIGGVLGLLLAMWIVDLLRAWGSGSVPRLDELRVDGRVVAVAALLSIVTGVASGFAPAWYASRVDLIATLRDGGPSMTGSARVRYWREALVVVEITLALVLLAGAALVARSLLQAQSIDLGFNPDRVMSVSLGLPRTAYDHAKATIFVDDFLGRAAALPQIERAGAVSNVPFGGPNTALAFAVEGIEYPPNAAPDADFRLVAGDYFAVMNMAIVAGRAFTAADRLGATPAMIVAESLAKRYFGGRDPVGTRVRVGDVSRGPWLTVVGVVRDARYYGLEAPTLRPMFYRPMAQTDATTMTLVVQTGTDEATVGTELRQVVRSIDPSLPIMRLASLDSLVDQAYAVRRFNAGLFTSFGLLAVVLACVGLAGTMAYAVSERTRELAVRVALGAEPGNLVLRVVGRGVALALGGVGLGLALGLPLTRFLDRLLYNVDPRDPAMLAVVSIALLAIAAVTSYIPARRVSRVDPVMVFRE